MGCFVRGGKNGMGCFVPGCFVLHSKSSYQNKGLLVRTNTCQVFSLTLTVRGVSNKHCLLTFFIVHSC